MATVLRKKQFVDDGDGNLIVRAHIVPKTADGAASKVEAGSQEYSSSNDAVATVEKDENDPNKLIIGWVGAGTVQITATGDADLDQDETKTVSGSIELKLEEEEADTLDIVLDDVTPL